MKQDYIFMVAGIIIFIILFISGCINAETPSPKKAVYSMEEAKAACIKLCEAEKNAGRDLSQGPCLSNEIVKDWVCDIAHSPRDPMVDNMPQNQCSAFLKQEAHNFIELDTDCRLIQHYEKK